MKTNKQWFLWTFSQWILFNGDYRWVFEISCCRKFNQFNRKICNTAFRQNIVARLLRRNVWIFCFQLRYSICAARIVFLIVFINRSFSALARGHYGVIFLCLNPILSANFRKWPRANAENERFMKTIRKTIRAAHIEYRSWKQKIHTFLRNNRATPHATTDKSLLICFHTLLGNSDICNGSNVLFGVDVRQGIHDLQVFSTSLSIPGKYTFSRNGCFVHSWPYTKRSWPSSLYYCRQNK
jgi:hypothetical protein